MPEAQPLTALYAHDTQACQQIVFMVHTAMISADDIRALRARLDENQEQFGQRFGLSRFDVAYWEKYGIASKPDLEHDMQKLINGGNSE